MNVCAFCGIFQSAKLGIGGQASDLTEQALEALMVNMAARKTGTDPE